MTILSQIDSSVVWIAVGLFLVFAIVVFIVVWSLAKPWLQAVTGGCPISVLQIFAMRMRKIDPKQIIPHGVAAAQAGFPIGWNTLESAYLQGVDIEKVVTAFVTSSKRGDSFSFDELVDAERESRLQQMLDR